MDLASASSPNIPANAVTSADTTTKALPFAKGLIAGPITIPERGLSCLSIVASYLATASSHSGSSPVSVPLPIPMDTRQSSVPSHTASISGHSVRMASRLLIPSIVSIWMIIAAWSFKFSWMDLDLSMGMSVRPRTSRYGGAEREPLFLTPNLAAETMCFACSTVSTCGKTMLAPASSAKPIAA